MLKRPTEKIKVWSIFRKKEKKRKVINVFPRTFPLRRDILEMHYSGLQSKVGIVDSANKIIWKDKKKMSFPSIRR